MCSGSSCTARQKSNLVAKYSSLIVYYEKNINYAENKHNRTYSSVSMHTNTPSVTIQGNVTAIMYRIDVIRSVLFLHIRHNHGLMLARDYASCHAARSTLIMRVANIVHKLRWPANSLDLNPIADVLDLLKRKVRAQSLQLYSSGSQRVLFIRCQRSFRNSIFKDVFNNEYTVHCCRYDTR